MESGDEERTQHNGDAIGVDDVTYEASRIDYVQEA